MKTKLFYLSLIICCIPLFIGLMLYDKLPEMLPIHWNVAGEVDNYAKKDLALYGMPVFFIIMHIFTNWMMHKDPKYQNIPNIMFYLMYFFIPFLSIFITCFTILTGLGYIDINIASYMPIIIGCVFIILGNYLPKCKQSYTVGIKTPWALCDEENWNKTHRFSGFVWTIGGLLMILSVLLPNQLRMTSIIGIALVIAWIPFAYSYLLYKKKGNK